MTDPTRAMLLRVMAAVQRAESTRPKVRIVKEDEEDWDGSVTEAEYWWTGAAARWRSETGTSLRRCMCPEFCGKEACQLQIAHLATGALLGVEELSEYVIKPEPPPTPAPVPSIDDLSVASVKAMSNDERLRVAEALEQELAELAEARRRANMHKRENQGGVFDGA